MNTTRRTISFAPVVYEHAAAFTEETPYEVSRSAELLFRAHAAAYDFYHHSPISVGIDVYDVEAEAYGAEVPDPGLRNVPSVARPVVSRSSLIPGLPDYDVERESRFGIAFQAATLLRNRYPGADVRIPLGGPFSIASNLLGFDNLLCECITEPDAVRTALEFLARKQVRVAEACAARGFGISFFESAAAPPLLSPELFRELELPALRIYCEGAGKALSKAPALIVGGDTYPVLPELISLNPSFLICPGETDQRAFMVAMQGRPDIGVRINMRVNILAGGTDAEVEEEARRVIDLAIETAVHNRPLLVGTGVLPVETDPLKIRSLGMYVAEYAARAT